MGLGFYIREVPPSMRAYSGMTVEYQKELCTFLARGYVRYQHSCLDVEGKLIEEVCVNVELFVFERPSLEDAMDLAEDELDKAMASRILVGWRPGGKGVAEVN